MADINNLSQFLTDVADSIRTKKGTTEPIPAENFDTEIESIVTGTVVEKVEVEASKIVEEDEVVKIESAPIEEPIMIPENGTIQTNTDKAILAETIGLSSDKIAKGNTILGINGTAEGGSGGEINNQDKNIIKNGEYVADVGYTGFGTVTVNVKENVHWFKSMDDMNTKTDYLNGDIAIVKQSILQPVTSENYISGNEIIWYPAQTAFFTKTPSANESLLVMAPLGSRPGIYNTVVADKNIINIVLYSTATLINNSSLTIIYNSEDGHNYTLSNITHSDGTSKDIINGFSSICALKVGTWLTENSTVADIFEQLFMTYFNVVTNVYEAKTLSEENNDDLYPSDYTQMSLSSDNMIISLPDVRMPIHLSDYKDILLKMGSGRTYYCMCDTGSKIYMTIAASGMDIIYDVISKKYYCGNGNATYYIYDKHTNNLSTGTGTECTARDQTCYLYGEIPATSVGFSIFTDTDDTFDENSEIHYNSVYICDFLADTTIDRTYIVDNDITRGPIALVNSIISTISASDVTKNKTCLSSSGFIVGDNVTPITIEDYDKALDTASEILGEEVIE